MKGPGQQNELAKKAKKMKFPLQMSKVDYGGSRSITVQKTSLCSSGSDHKCYGTRAIAMKGESSLLQDLHAINENDDELAILPDLVVSEIKSNIRKGAKDLEQPWKDALELTKRAYFVSNLPIPQPTQSKAWKQYEDLIKFGVQQLSATRGLNGDWRFTTPSPVSEGEQQYKHIGSKRFYVQINGVETKEVEAKNLDEIIEKVSNKIRASRDVHNAKVSVDHRTERGAILIVTVDGIKREKIVIKQHG